MIKPSEYDKYSASPWSQWDVAPAQLTAHGYKLIKLFGDWDRIDLLGKGRAFQRCCRL
jgi:4-phytase/acid phosphatase